MCAGHSEFPITGRCWAHLALEVWKLLSSSRIPCCCSPSLGRNGLQTSHTTPTYSKLQPPAKAFLYQHFGALPCS
jgi:hypothetical protein